MRAEIKASVWYILSSTLSRGVTLLATPIFTRLLTPEQYATYPLYVSYMGIFTVLATFEIPGSITYSGLSRFGEEGTRGFMLSALLAEILLSLAFLSLYLPLRNAINSITGMGTTLTLILILQVFLNSAESLYFSKKRFFGAYRWVTLVNSAVGILTPLLSILLIKSGLTGGARIISQLAVSTLLVSYAIYKTVSEGRGLIRGKYFRYIFGLAVPMLPHYLALSVTTGIDKIMISSLLGADALGKYSAAFSVGFIISIVGSGIQMALSPWIIKRTVKGSTEGVREALLASQSLLSVITMLFLCVAPEIFRIFTGAAYQEALGVIYPVAISSLFSFSSTLCVSASVKLGKARGVTAVTLQTMLLSVGLNYLLISRVGYIGGAIAALLASVARFFLNFSLLCKEESRESLKVKSYLQNLCFVAVFGIVLYALKSVSVSRIMMFLALSLILLSLLTKYKKLLRG